MFENDYPLLGTPSLTAVILHLAVAEDVTLDACLDRFAALLAAAHEPAPLPRAAIGERFAGLIHQFEIARLLDPVSTGVWRLTPRGRAVAESHPQGLDPSDLVRYPEYAGHIRASAASRAESDPRAASYDAGYGARQAGLPFTANPHPPTSADYLAWENGWMEALDEERP